jgi:DnaK suppressor protein
MKKMTERLQDLRGELGAEIASDVALLARSLDDKGEDVTVSQHPADVASDLYAREELVAEERVLEAELADVDDALSRIVEGTYGVCIACGREIPLARLEARPQASRCIECERLAESARRR